jgi:hypothetical protein
MGAKAKRPAARYVAASKKLAQKDVEAVGAILERLTGDDEGDVPRRLVEASRPKTSATHHLFEWDNNAAADLYRLVQAQRIIRGIEIVFEDPEGEEVRGRAFPSLSIGGSGERGYMPLAKVLSDEDLTRQLVEEAKADAAAWARRHEAIRKLAEARVMFSAVDAFTGKKPIMS